MNQTISIESQIREMSAEEIESFVAQAEYTAAQYHLCAEQYRLLTGKELQTAHFS